MICLHYSNRLEELIAPLAAAIARHQRGAPLARAVVVVPNRIVEEYLKLRLAEVIGVAANIEFPFLRRYLARVVQAADPAVGVLEADDLELVIFECLRSAVDRHDPEFSAVAQYVAGGTQRPEDCELRLFQLSVRTARLFREYAISRAAMLARWRGGTAPGLDSMRESERWQRRLYLSILEPDDSLAPRWIANQETRRYPLTSALAMVAADKLAAALARPLHIFGLSYAGPEFARIFAKLGELTAVHIYALNPCMEFWEDVDSAYAGARDRFVSRGHRVGAALDTADDPFGLDGPGDNAALRLWGKPGREYIRLLNELTGCDFDPHFNTPLDGAGQGSLLARVQQSILLREPETSAAPPAGAGARDESIRFLACPGIRREVEIVADSIWSLITGNEKDGAARPLRFHQIAVVIPDAELDSYLPHVETVFEERHQIPLNMVDRPFSAQGRVVEAVELLLRLALGHFARDEVLHLVTHPAIAGEAQPDAGRWEDWCQSLGVFFGADEREFAGTYIPANHYHWDQGLRRLALGAFMAGDNGGETRTVSAAQGEEYLPCEIAQDDIASAGALILSVRKLIAEALDLRARRLPMIPWARLLSDLIRTYVRPADPAGRAIADRCVAAIESMASDELRGEPVSYPVACARALGRIADAQSEQGRYAESGVAVGSFAALRSIPFRVIFAMGLGETIFPEREKHDLLDLRLARRRAGDVSANQRDRYLFLETLLAARERLVLSWVSRDALTGQELEPSALISELKLIAGRYLPPAEIDALTTVHHRSRYDLEYFPDLAGKVPINGLVSFDRHAREGARMSALRADLDKSCGNAALAAQDQELLDILPAQVRDELAPALRIVQLPDAVETGPAPQRIIPLSLGALRRFLECPLQGAARYALGMMDDDDADYGDVENEPLTQTRLDLVVMLRDAFWRGRGEAAAVNEAYAQALHLHQLEGKAPVGPFADVLRTEFSRRLDLCLQQTRVLKIANLEGWERIRFGAAEEAVEADRVLPPIILDVKMRRLAGDMPVRVSLRGTVAVSPQRNRSIRCIARASGAGPRDFLEGFLGAIALAAAGETNARNFQAIAVGSPGDSTDEVKITRELKMLSAGKACEYLTALANDLFSANNYCFLPIDAVAELYKRTGKAKPTDRLIWDTIEELRDNDFHPCSSDYGPIRNPRLYRPPPPREVKEIMKRRFDPIRAIFGQTA